LQLDAYFGEEFLGHADDAGVCPGRGDGVEADGEFGVELGVEGAEETWMKELGEKTRKWEEGKGD
jgi:hypothetical protein